MIDHLQMCVKSRSRCSNPGVESSTEIIRAAHMQYMLFTRQCLTDLDRVDVDLIYEIGMDEETEWVFGLLNEHRNELRRMGNVFKMALEMTRSVVSVFTE